MEDKLIMLNYSRWLQELLPKVLDLSELDFESRDLCLHSDGVMLQVSIALSEYLRSRVASEFKVIPTYCLPSEILKNIEEKINLVDQIGLKNVKPINIIRAVYAGIRSRVIFALLEEKASGT